MESRQVGLRCIQHALEGFIKVAVYRYVAHQTILHVQRVRIIYSNLLKDGVQCDTLKGKLPQHL